MNGIVGSGPPEVLAELAHRLYGWSESGLVQPGWIGRADDAMIAMVGAGAPLDAGIAANLAEARGVLARAAVQALDFDLFVGVAWSLQRIDEWHAPLRLAAGPATVLDDMHRVALGRFGAGAAYNALAGFGAIIPPAVVADPPPVSDDAGIVARLLHETAYLPPRSAAGDPDDASMPSARTVELRYVSTGTRSSDPRAAVDDRPVIAIAPVLQDLADAELTLRSGPDRYGVEVRYDHARFDEILGRAMAEGAHLLFMPEMSIDAERVPDLASAIRRAVAAHDDATGDLPELRFVIAGVSHGKGGTGGNSIVVLDGEGAQILEQEKLCRWNLKWYHQHAYGVRPGCASTEPDLSEDIAAGRRVWIADLAQVGRFLTLICADMDYDKPGDWLIRNVAVDWLHAPIMDRSIAWSMDAAGFHPWIVDRAYRATTLGVPKVVVTNSVYLTLRQNVTNSVPGARYPVLDECAVAFMLDRTDAPTTYRQVDVTVPCAALQVTALRWLDGFQPFPPP